LIAEEMANQGASVTLVLGPSAIVPKSLIKVVDVETAEEMYNSCTSEFENSDITIMCAAVADYKTEESAVHKIKKTDDSLTLHLTKTKDILKELGQRKKDNQFLCGFALETNDEEHNAKAKIESKNLDMIVLNSLNDEKAGFGFDTNKITIFDNRQGKYSFPNKSKKEVAKDIVAAIIKFQNV
jgi:phosphopantothenoylcysteine decarboxylase/phosphopantothenate--cysteine ligase